MGLYLSLNISPSIDSKQWDRFWCESLQLLQKFPLPLVRPAKYKSRCGDLKIWSNKLVHSDKHGEFWEISGDAETLIFGEKVRIYRDFEYYQNQWESFKQDEDRKDTDPLFCQLKDYDEPDVLVPLNGLELFFVRTQGYPYHHALAAVSLLAEYRFPSAITWGDLGAKGSEAVCQWLATLYEDDKMPMPICHDAARLWNRIEGVCGDITTTMKRFEERFLGSASRTIHRMLIESRETTMQKIAEDLLEFDSITLGFKKISKSFLEATDDIDQYLDLIHLRNTLAKSRTIPKKKRYQILSLDKVLGMLIGSFVCYSKWQGEELQTLRRWVIAEGNIQQMMSSALWQVGIPDFFDFYCSEKDLLEAFTQREPDNRRLFEKVIREQSAKNEKSLEMIGDIVRHVKNMAVEELGEEEELDIEPEDYFDHYMKGEAYMQSELLQPMNEENVALLGQHFGNQLVQMQDIVSGSPEGIFLDDPTGNNQKKALLRILKRCNVRLLKNAVQEIERTKNVELLNLFTPLSPFLFDPGFRMQGPILFGEEFESYFNMLWHLFNKPAWWNTFCEHRNDSPTEFEE